MQSATPSSRNIVILTGAGISRESGLDTFRDADGIWARRPPRGRGDARGVRARSGARPRVLQRAPAQRCCRSDGRAERGAPGAGALERDWPDEVLVVTQNIDDLHDRAGSRNLIHMHGEMLKVRCDGLRGRRPMAHRSRHAPTLSPAARRRAAAARGLVRRDAARDGPDLRGAGRLRAVRVDRHLGQRLSGGGLRPPRQELRRRPHYRAQPGAVHRGKPVRRGHLRPGDRVVPRFVDRLLANVVAAGS